MTILNALRSGRLRESIGCYWYPPLLLVIGAFAGTRLLIIASNEPFVLLLGAVLFVYLNMERLGKTNVRVVCEHPQASAVVFGLVAGVFEGTANVSTLISCKIWFIINKRMNNDTSYLEEGTIMKGNTFLLALLVLGLLVLTSSSSGIAGILQDIKNRGKLIAGVKTDFPPFGFLDQKGDHKGFDIDLAKAISKELFGSEEKVEFISVTTGNRVAFLTSGKIDLVAATMSITAERMREIDFSTPYFMTGQMILVQGENKIAKYQDLAGKKVATIQGSIGDIAIGQMVPNVERVRFEQNHKALQALKDRHVEAFVQDYVLLFNLLQKNPGLKIADLEPFRVTPYSLGVRKGDKEWLDFINSTLAMIAQSGESEKLLDKWFGQEAKVLLRSFKK